MVNASELINFGQKTIKKYKDFIPNVKRTKIKLVRIACHYLK